MSLPDVFFVAEPRDVLRLTGRDRQSFLQGMVTNDIAALTPGHGCYAFHLKSTGQVLADCRIACLAESLLIDTEPGWGEPLAASLEHHLVMERVKVALTESAPTVFIAGAGVAAHFPTLESEGDNTLVGEAAVVKTTLINAPGVRVFGDATALLTTLGAVALPTTTRDGLRIEAGVPQGRVDFDEKTLAPETGQIARAIHYKKGCYIGQEIVARIDARGHTNRTLVGLITKTLAMAGATVTVDGVSVGRVTSVAVGPTLGVPLALGYLRNEHATPGTAVLVDGQPAVVSSLPFERASL